MALMKHLDFEIFRPKLAEVFTKEKKSLAGRKPFDVVAVFKILIRQSGLDTSITGKARGYFEKLQWYAEDRAGHLLWKKQAPQT